ncbi:hypothetical protein DBR47_03580 [Paucibacter sp. KBW04]|uniref:acyltransferase family protein n=1 Tax=Paucibacter sp. KBW04 TaxID=2153361 RepID=UPI000F576E3A|nr:acyltransferase [Paucibacter sp. KBW04]RQO62339.1 hypothetical protein DBR47_03580 [Paucibacter sp. KBW04]
MITSLQAGRAIAAFSVAAFHLWLGLGSPSAQGWSGNTFLSIWSQGFLGVDYFFVLSGFIILQAHFRDIGQAHRTGKYLARRAIRIFPIYWIYLSACILGMWLVKSDHLQLGGALDWFTSYSLIRLSNVELPLAQAWTLFHEIAFYAIFALLILNRRWGLAAFIAWMLVVAFNFHYPSNASQNLLSVLTGAYNLNFCIGMLSFLLVQRLASKATASLALLLGLALFAAMLAFRANGGAVWSPLGCAIAFGLVMSGAAALELKGGLRVPVWLSLLGDASYSTYLLHEHVESYSLRALSKLGFDYLNSPVITFFGVMAVVLSVGLAAYLGLERPLMKRLRPWVDRHFSGQPTHRQASAN